MISDKVFNFVMILSIGVLVVYANYEYPKVVCKYSYQEKL